MDALLQAFKPKKPLEENEAAHVDIEYSGRSCFRTGTQHIYANFFFIQKLFVATKFKIKVSTDAGKNATAGVKGGPLELNAHANKEGKEVLLTSAEGGGEHPYVVWGMKLKRLEFGDPNRPRKSQWKRTPWLPLRAEAGGVVDTGPSLDSTAQDFDFDEYDMKQMEFRSRLTTLRQALQAAEEERTQCNEDDKAALARKIDDLNAELAKEHQDVLIWLCSQMRGFFVDPRVSAMWEEVATSYLDSCCLLRLLGMVAEGISGSADFDEYPNDTAMLSEVQAEYSQLQDLVVKKLPSQAAKAIVNKLGTLYSLEGWEEGRDIRFVEGVWVCSRLNADIDATKEV